MWVVVPEILCPAPKAGRWLGDSRISRKVHLRTFYLSLVPQNSLFWRALSQEGFPGQFRVCLLLNDYSEQPGLNPEAWKPGKGTPDFTNYTYDVEGVALQQLPEKGVTDTGHWKHWMTTVFVGFCSTSKNKSFLKAQTIYPQSMSWK